ncbi:hypothetical protein QJS04_geneDACA012763 [Acorus gramineus]|uniref:Uncharacterized protein n=1 Tax=Acorus gramineus TaxID=55184 RepID=A0AAV9A220_ACOGR|nr:hypothetical protein QJS04_geneDACA012763 [Acorus gramineus]
MKAPSDLNKILEPIVSLRLGNPPITLQEGVQGHNIVESHGTLSGENLSKNDKSLADSKAGQTLLILRDSRGSRLAREAPKPPLPVRMCSPPLQIVSIWSVSYGTLEV